MLLDTGDYKAAQEELSTGLALTRRIGARRFEAWFLTFLAKAAFVEGRRDEAASLAAEAIEISRETGITFAGPLCFGVLALVTRDPEVRRDALAEGESVLAKGCVSHNYLWFYTDAMTACVNSGETSSIPQYADALEAYFLVEPLRTSDYFVRWGRTLAALGGGERGDKILEDLRQLRQQAEDFEIAVALPALNAALDDLPARSNLRRAD